MSRTVVKEIKKTKAKNERNPNKTKKTGVRPEVSKLIDKVIKENAPTWEALANR